MKRTLLFAALIALVLVACNLPTKNDTKIDMTAIATLGAVTASAPTQGVAPTLMPVASLTPIPYAATPNPQMGSEIIEGAPTLALYPYIRRIEFAQGGSSATIVSTATKAEGAQFILYAFQGQRMIIKITSPGDIANFAIQSYTDRIELKWWANENHTWDGILPVSDNYMIYVTSGGEEKLDFKLTVTILWE
jgi:hypothetical protein